MDTIFKSMAALQLSDFSDVEDIDLAFRGGVYVFLGEDDAVVYIGQSGFLAQRLREHARTKRWWASVERTLVYPIADPEWRLVLETLLILRYRPAQNRAIKLALRKDGGIVEVQFASNYTRKKKRKQ